MKNTLIEADWLDEKCAAAQLGLTIYALRSWRYRKTGPPFTKFGRAVRYHIHSLAEFAASRTVDPVK